MTGSVNNPQHESNLAWRASSLNHRGDNGLVERSDAVRDLKVVLAN